MTTPLRIKAFDLWEMVLNKYSWKFPISWNLRGKCLQTIDQENSYNFAEILKQFKTYFISEIIMMSIGAGCSVFLFLKEILMKSNTHNISLFQFFVLGTSTCIATLTGLFSFSFLFNQRYLTFIFSELFRIEKSLKVRSNRDNLILDTQRSFDIVGIIINCVVGFAIISPLTVIPFVCYFRSDPLYHIFQLAYPYQNNQSSFNEKIIHAILMGFRITVETYVSFGACRTLSFTMIIFVLGSKILLVCASQLRTQSIMSSNFKVINSTAFLKYITEYRGFYILVEFLNYTIVMNMTLGCLSGGFIVEVTSVFVIIRMSQLYYLVPIMYLCTICLAVAVPVMVHIILPEAVELYDQTQTTIRLWNLQTTSFALQRKYILRVLRAVRPCLFYSGIAGNKFFAFRRSTITAYYSILIYYVVNFLISVPESTVNTSLNLSKINVHQ